MEAEETNMKSWQLEKNINPASPTKFRHHLRVGIFIIISNSILILILNTIIIISNRSGSHNKLDVFAFCPA